MTRIKICRKETKETIFWIELTETLQEETKEKEELLNEVNQLIKIFGSILEKSK